MTEPAVINQKQAELKRPLGKSARRLGLRGEQMIEGRRAARIGIVIAIVWLVPGNSTADNEASGLTADLERQMCQLNRMYRECVNWVETQAKAPRGGSDVYREPSSALSSTSIQQCNAILVRLDSYYRQCLLDKERVPDYPLDCQVFLRRDWPPGAC